MAQHPFDYLRQTLRRSRAINGPLTIASIAFGVALIGTLVGFVLDHRVITGMPAWNKPAKFMLSSAIYSVTFLWLLRFVQGHKRLVRSVAWMTSVGLLVEDGLIALQVIRGTTSHFNISTPFDTAVWGIMGVTVVGIWTATLILGFVLLRQRFADAAFAWALRFGVFISLIGMGLAFLMTSPTAMQRTAAKAGGGMPIAGAHAVGVADGGPGLPFLGWSTIGGDLRVPHFVGLHGLQLLPVFGWLLIRYGTRLRPAARTALVWIAGLGYLGFVGLLTWQALRGQSVVAPDARTFAAGGLLLAAVVSATLITLRSGWSDATIPSARLVPSANQR